MLYVLYVLHVIICIFLILTVLLQRGKGADLSVFGGGSTQAAFGARGATTLLHKLTVGFFVAFIVSTMVIALFQGREGGSSSVLSDQPAQEAGSGDEEGEEQPASLTGEPEEPAATEPGADPGDSTGEAPAEAPAEAPPAQE